MINKILTKKMVLVYIWTEQCASCTKMTPIVEEVAKENSKDIQLIKLSAESNLELIKKYKVTYLPTTLIFRHGVLIERRAGRRSRQVLSKKIQMIKSFSEEDAKNNELCGVTLSKLSRNQYSSLWM